MNRFEPEEFIKKKRLVIVALVILLLIQVVTLVAYFFKEKQVALAPPMFLGIFINGYALINLWKLGN